jgi:secreted trypsin-like serine protease
VDGIIDEIDPGVINKYSTIPNANDTLLVLGWGMTVFGDESSYAEVLQIAALRYINPDACKSMKNENGQSLGDWILEDHLCAWEERKDACSGDSGSPLIVPGSSRKGDVLVGVVSWGVDCAGPLPGVYGRTSYMYSWLEQVICTLSSSPPNNMECKSYDVGTHTTSNITRCNGCDSTKRQDDDALRKSGSNGIPTGNGITWFSAWSLTLWLWICKQY